MFHDSPRECISNLWDAVELNHNHYRRRIICLYLHPVVQEIFNVVLQREYEDRLLNHASHLDGIMLSSYIFQTGLFDDILLDYRPVGTAIFIDDDRHVVRFTIFLRSTDALIDSATYADQLLHRDLRSCPRHYIVMESF